MTTPWEPKTPRTLVERLCRENDDRDWAQFVDLYTPVLFHWVRRLGTPLNEAEDAVQGVFAHLSRKLPEFHYQRNQRFRPWLWTVTSNKIRESQRRKPDASTRAGQLTGLEMTPDPLQDWAEAEYRRRLALQAMNVMHQEFTESTVQAFMLYVVEGQSAEAVAATVGISVGAVYKSKSRVLPRLRQELDGMWD